MGITTRKNTEKGTCDKIIDDVVNRFLCRLQSMTVGQQMAF
jgi:hypothetical protein